jgi:hypothetical protein
MKLVKRNTSPRPSPHSLRRLRERGEGEQVPALLDPVASPARGAIPAKTLRPPPTRGTHLAKTLGAFLPLRVALKGQWGEGRGEVLRHTI